VDQIRLQIRGGGGRSGVVSGGSTNKRLEACVDGKDVCSFSTGHLATYVSKLPLLISTPNFKYILNFFKFLQFYNFTILQFFDWKAHSKIFLTGGMMENYEKAITAAKNLSSHEGDGHRVINFHSNYLGGALYVIGFKTPKNEERTNYVYIEGNDVTVCKNSTMLNDFVARKSKKGFLASLVEALEGVAGIIGLIITIAIVFMFINNPKVEIPQILSASLTTILGFYFGKKSK
jgi:hypothetical protein